MKNILIAAYLALNVFSLPALATSWPIFTYPDKKLLLNLDYLTTEGCPSGEGRLKTNSTINISQHNCQNFCPEDWTWVSNSDESCHKLDEISFKGYQITHFPDDRFYEYSIVTAAFGPENSTTVHYEFVMKTTPDKNFPWYCTVSKPRLDLVTCANDF